MSPDTADGPSVPRRATASEERQGSRSSEARGGSDPASQRAEIDAMHDGSAEPERDQRVQRGPAGCGTAAGRGAVRNGKRNGLRYA
jgi:hypothetical protein